MAKLTLGLREGCFIALAVEGGLCWMHANEWDWHNHYLAGNIAYVVGYCAPIPALFAIGWLVTSIRARKKLRE